jgi:hypothetical protein
VVDANDRQEDGRGAAESSPLNPYLPFRQTTEEIVDEVFLPLVLPTG